MKKSTIIINLLRAAFVVLAYQHIVTPKSAMITPGTGRTTAHYLKSCYTISRGYILSQISRLRNALTRKRSLA